MGALTTTFTLVLTAGLIVRFWLAYRQIAHVTANRSRVPAPFRRRISPAEHRKAADYTVAKVRFGRIVAMVDVALVLLWTLGGGLDLVDNWWRSSGLGPLSVGAAFLISIFIISGIIELPASWYQAFVIEQRFGFNRMTTALFAADWLKQTIMTVALGLPLAYGALYLMNKAGQYWWVYLWLLWCGFILLMIWAYPAFIAPWFNRFTRLKNRALANRIERLLKKSGFRSRGIYIMDGSRRSAHGNAYFTGLGRNKRIVFFDTLLESLRPPEIEAVLAHELGHFHHHHVPKKLMATFGISFLGLAALGWLAEQPWFYLQLGVSQVSSHTAIALFLMAGPAFTFFLQPVTAWSSRRHEFQADAFAVERSNASALIRALVKLYRENATTLTPDALHSAFYDSHPPAPIRIANIQSQP